MPSTLVTFGASATGVHTFGVAEGALTQASLAIAGGAAGAIAGGPVYVTGYLVRGEDRLKLFEGYLYGKRPLYGSGCVTVGPNTSVIIDYENKTGGAVVAVFTTQVECDERKRDSGWYHEPVTWDNAPVLATLTANPAAGADPAAFTVPTAKRWLVLGLSNVIVTDANVANRYPYIRVTSGTAVFMFMSPLPVTASLTQTFAAGPACPAGGVIGAGLSYSFGFPSPLEIVSATTLRWQYLNIQATDDAAACYLLYKELPT